jgi:hypothetical protein
VTNREVIQGYRLFAADKSGKLSDDNSWSTRLVLFFLNMYKSKLIFEKRVGEGSINQFNVQTIPCIEMVRLDIQECPCAPLTGTYFAKSLYPVPRPIGGKFIVVNSTTGSEKYDYTRWESFKDIVNSRIPAERYKPYYTLKNINSPDKVHLYVLQKENLKLGSISAVFEDPLEVASFPACGQLSKNLCNPLEEDFVIDRELLPVVYELTFQKLINIKQATGSDIITNNIDDTSVPAETK